MFAQPPWGVWFFCVWATIWDLDGDSGSQIRLGSCALIRQWSGAVAPAAGRSNVRPVLIHNSNQSIPLSSEGNAR